jgi:hypothetical protein
LSREGLEYLRWCAREYGDLVPLRFFWKRILFVNHPDYIEQVLATNHRRVVKDLGQRADRALIGNGLFLSEGDCWLRQRRMMQPAFHRERIAAYGEVLAAYAERMVELDVVVPRADDGDRHGWQAYVIQLERRDEAMAGLRAQGIQCQIGTYALHRLGAYRDQGAFPGADAAYERALALPFHTRLTDAELDRVVEALRPYASS